MEKRYYKHKIENLLVISKIVTIHYFEFGKDYAAPTESHNFWEMVYADKGELLCTANGREVVLAEGEAIFHKPNEAHSLRANGRIAPNVFIVSFETKSESVHFFENRRLRLEKRLLPYIYAVIEESKKTFDLPYSDPELKKMPLLKTPALGGRQLIKNLLEVLLIHIMRDETEKPSEIAAFLPKEELDSRITRQTIEFLRAHIRENVTVQEVCAHVHYNKSHLFAQFKAATGRSVMAYFTLLKIEAAKKDLRESDEGIAEISNRYAFDSPNYFSKTFKKITRYTPSTYRKIHRTKT